MIGRSLATYFGVLSMMIAFDSDKAGGDYWKSLLLAIMAYCLFMWANRD